MAEMGVHSVAYAFPKVRIITTAVDKEVNDQFHIIPGIGEEVSVPALSLSCITENEGIIRKRTISCCLCLISLAVFVSSEGNFGDRYFGTDAPSDWCESDEGMDF